MDPLESQNAQDARVERLWRQLDTLKKGELDLAGLRRGLQKIDHRQLPTFASAVDTDI
jgi:solute carrier family 25 (mitochondrial phosphate transporter), member 23/24/25/41